MNIGVKQRVEAPVIELPRFVTCGVCHGYVVPGCPQCDGRGTLPFPAMPSCATGGCAAAGISLLGHSTDGEQLPIYVCSRGHYTAVRYVENGGSGADG